MNQPLPTFPDDFNLANYFLFDRLKEGRGTNIALRFGSHSFTYEQVADRSLRTATVFRNHGLVRGGRVLIILRDIPAFSWVFFGVLAAGGVVVMGNPDAPIESLSYLVHYTQAQLVIAPKRVVDGLRTGNSEDQWPPFCVVDEPSTGENPLRTLDLSASENDIDLEHQVVSLAPTAVLPSVRTHRDEHAIWLFTSGSTGKPKAAMHCHRDFAFNTEVFAKATVNVCEEDIFVSVPRLFFGYATGTNLMFPFAVGASVGMFAERPTPESFLQAIKMYRPTVLTQVPTMMGKILDFDEQLRASGEQGLDLSSVRFSFSAGEALPGGLLRRWQERFASDVYDGIGSAEMFHIYASNRPGDIKVGSLGKAVSGYELAILPEDAPGVGASRCETGEIGVLWVKGDSVAQGYWLDRAKSWETFHGHWCRTGDLFHMDEDGYLYFDGRADDLIKVSGIFVAPREVEECLCSHPAVAAAAVFGSEDQGLIKPKALVILKPSYQEQLREESALVSLRQNLKDHVKQTLAKHKYPRFVVFVPDLPKNDRGKVDRKLLKERELQGTNPGEQDNLRVFGSLHHICAGRTDQARCPSCGTCSRG
jgi:benzoate-CoA ligase family protein